MDVVNGVESLDTAALHKSHIGLGLDTAAPQEYLPFFLRAAGGPSQLHQTNLVLGLHLAIAWLIFELSSCKHRFRL